MGPRLDLRTVTSVRLPRVSGDGPDEQLSIAWRQLATPRERGLAPCTALDQAAAAAVAPWELPMTRRAPAISTWSHAATSGCSRMVVKTAPTASCQGR